MPGVVGIIARQNQSSTQLHRQYDEMLRLLTHFDFYRTETVTGDGYVMGRVGLPHRGYSHVRKDGDSGNAVAFDGYLYGWHGRCSSPTPHLAEPVSLVPLKAGSELDKIPDAINGQFTIALHDAGTDTFHLGTDRLGYRRLYYYQNERVIVFAPEIRAFMAVDGFTREVDPEAMADFFNYSFVLGERTMYRGVSLLHRASMVTVKERRLSPARRYWKMQIEEVPDTDPTVFIRPIYDAALEALKCHMGNHQKFFIALSGGMDSRFMAHLAEQTGVPVRYYSHGDVRSDDARIARIVARKMGIEDRFEHIDVDPECYAHYGAWTVWLTEGMTGIAPAALASLLPKYHKEGPDSEFLNSLLVGPANFTLCFGQLRDITRDLDLTGKVNRIKGIMGMDYLTDDYYRVFNPDLREFLKRCGRAHVEAEMERVAGAGPTFVYEKDVFAMETRVHRLSLQYDLYRYYYHDHQGLSNDRAFDLRNQVPPQWLSERRIYYRIFQELLPDLSRIEYQGTGVDLFSKPTPAMLARRQRQARMRHWLKRLSLGRINLDDLNTYVHPDHWYRRHRSNRQFVEGVLLDPRTAARGFYDMTTVKGLLRKQALGSDNFGTLASLTGFELFNRWYIDGDAPPKPPAA